MKYYYYYYWDEACVIFVFIIGILLLLLLGYYLGFEGKEWMGRLPRQQFQKSISDGKIRNVTEISTFCSRNSKPYCKMLKIADIIQNVTAKC